MKLIIFDDDPTGSQTVFDCPLLLSFDKESLVKALHSPSPLIFLLTNTRALSSNLVEEKLRNICRSLLEVLQREGLDLEDTFFVSRGDSTLRGHGVLEPEILNEELGPFDATFHVPAFFEGGRTTSNGVHLLDGTPIHKTIFAKDNIFGFTSSYLPDWLEEKSNGKIKSTTVKSITIEQLDSAITSELGMEGLKSYLCNLSCNQPVIVNATRSSHLAVFGNALRSLGSKKKFLFRSAASLINGLSNIYSNANPITDYSAFRIKDSLNKPKQGLVIVGSHVQLAKDQLEVLLSDKDCIGVHLDVDRVAKSLEEELSEYLLAEIEEFCLNEIQKTLGLKKTPVLYTSRREIEFSTVSERMYFGLELANLMARLIFRIKSELGYIISKGGITTNIVLSKGLELDLVHLKGQILPGISLVRAYSSDKNNPLPVVTFPGNLGDKSTLLNAWKIMEGRQ